MNPRNLMLFHWNAKFLKAAVAYNLVLYAIFLTIYFFLDFKKHFVVEDGAEISARGKVYFAIMTHTAGGPQDIVPTTDFARMLMSVHVALAWAQLMLVFVS